MTPQELKLLANTVRAKRDALLRESDKTQYADRDSSIQMAWAPYRQALRDLPEQEGFPADVEWPKEPQP